MESLAIAVAMLAAAPFIGSFLGVLAQRLPENRPVAWSRSACAHCGHALAPIDLVPIASYLVLRGRCRYCHARIGRFALAIECAAFLVAAWAALQTSGWVIAVTCIFGWMLLVLAVIDWRVLLLPDVITLPLLVTGLAATALFDRERLVDHMIGAFAGFALFALAAFAYRVLRGREGLGFGDAKLLAGIGAWVSWTGLPTVVLWGSILGLVFALARAAAGRRLQFSDRLPFGTFLAAGGWLVWLYGPLIPGG
ncbi:MAG TPA: A24 family peptidase [Rhizomicrobium sp.]|nr:A24 family peptidase [Rhizomicrobium sp.]